MTIILHATGVTKSYGDTTVVSDVSLTVSAGESVAIMGASGSGKSTLLHCLAGITVPDSGSISLASGGAPVEITSLDDDQRSRLRRESLGFVFQSGLLIPELSAVENVALALMISGTSRVEAEETASAWLVRLGLAGLEDRRIGQLSGGQAQRVAIARAQVTGSSLVFADEPTGALDSSTSADVMGALLSTTTRRDCALIVVTHDPTVAARCSRVVTMQDGRLKGATGVAA